MHGYVLFGPRIVTPFREMDGTAGREYFREFVAAIPERLAILRSALDTNGGAGVPLDFQIGSLAALGGWLDVQVHRNGTQPGAAGGVPLPGWALEFVSDQDLAEATWSLCVDVGMYLGEVLIRRHDRLRWDYDRDPDSVHFNRPVVSGFPYGIAFEPVRIVSVVCYKTLEGRSASRELPRVMTLWDEDARA